MKALKIFGITFILVVIFGIFLGIKMIRVERLKKQLSGKIVFSFGDLYMADPKDIKGTIKEILSDKLIDYYYPCWSPNGKKITVAKVNDFPESDKNNNISIPLPEFGLMLLDFKGNIKEILDMKNTPCDYPSWSPDEGKICFITGTKYPIKEGVINLFNIDNSVTERIIDILVLPSRPSWSPDGRKILFASKDKGICSINYDGTELKQIINGTNPSWSPDGKKIAFRRGKRIYICDQDGNNVRKIAFHFVKASSEELVWSPDSKYLIYTVENILIPTCIASDMVVVSIERLSIKAKVYFTFGRFKGISWTR